MERFRWSVVVLSMFCLRSKLGVLILFPLGRQIPYFICCNLNTSRSKTRPCLAVCSVGGVKDCRVAAGGARRGVMPDLGLPPPSGVASSVHYYALQRNLGHVTRDTWVARHGQCMVWGTAGVGSAKDPTKTQESVMVSSQHPDIQTRGCLKTMQVYEDMSEYAIYIKTVIFAHFILEL